MSISHGCRDENEIVVPRNPTVTMRLGTQTFVLEVADTPKSRQAGLMYRRQMPDDHGMIFVFDHPQVLEFWMSHTYLPLDIAFVDSDGKVVALKSMEPLVTSPTTSSDSPALYAIELSRGAARRAGLRMGQVLALPTEITNHSLKR